MFLAEFILHLFSPESRPTPHPSNLQISFQIPTNLSFVLISYSVDRGCPGQGEEVPEEAAAAQEGGALQIVRTEHLQGRHRA